MSTESKFQYQISFFQPFLKFLVMKRYNCSTIDCTLNVIIPLFCDKDDGSQAIIESASHGDAVLCMKCNRGELGLSIGENWDCPICPHCGSNNGLTMDMEKKTFQFSPLVFFFSGKLGGREKGPAYPLFFQFYDLTVLILLIRTIVCCLPIDPANA